MTTRKKITILSSFVLLFIGCSDAPSTSESELTEQKSFKITCNIDGDSLENDVVYLKGYNEQKEFGILDSTNFIDGYFEFVGSVKKPSTRYISFKNNPFSLSILAENDNYSITGTSLASEDIKVSGGKLNTELTNFNNGYKAFDSEMDSLGALYWKAKEENLQNELTELEKKWEDVSNQRSDYAEKFVRSNPNSLVSGYVLCNVHRIYNLEDLEKFYPLLGDTVKNSNYGKYLEDKLLGERRTAIGEVAPSFAALSPDSTLISLDTLKGNYALIEFWASWCGPCRAESPYLKKAYAANHDKGFEIISISLDEDREPWLSAIEEDETGDWKHISDLKGFSSEIAKTYGVNSIPSTFLIDEKGVIVNKNMRGEEMLKELAEIYN